MAGEEKRFIDQVTDTELSAGDYIMVDSSSEGTRKFDLGTKLAAIDTAITSEATAREAADSQLKQDLDSQYDYIGITSGTNLFSENSENIIRAYINASSKITSNASNRMMWIKLVPNTKYHFYSLKSNTDFSAILCSEVPAIGVTGTSAYKTTSTTAGTVEFDFETTDTVYYLAWKYYNTSATTYTQSEILESVKITVAESVIEKMHNETIALQKDIEYDLDASFGLQPMRSNDSIPYDTNKSVALCRWDEDKTFEDVVIQMRLDNVVATVASANVLRLYNSNGDTVKQLQLGGLGMVVNKSYSKIVQVRLKNVTFNRVVLYPYSTGYSAFSSGTFSDFLLYDANGTYSKLSEEFMGGMEETIKSKIEEIAYDNLGSNTFGVITDIHQNYEAYTLTKSIAKYRQFRSLLVMGDLNNTSQTSLASTKTELIKTAKSLSDIDLYTKVLPERGNHDGVSGAQTYTSEMFTSAIIKPFIDDCSAIGDYFYDDSANKIRFIMLNDCADSMSRLGFANQTISFLQSALGSVGNDYSVVVSSHHPPINVTSANLPANSDQVVSILENFVSQNDGKLICYCYGHMHYDKLETVNGVVYVGTTASDTIKSVLALDVFCVDKLNRNVNIVRIGDAGENRTFTY